MYDSMTPVHYQFLRQNPLVAGVAGGIAQNFDLPVGLIRFILFVSFFTSFGLTLILYIAAAFSFSSKNYYESFGQSPKIFGICYYLSLKIGLDVGYIRFLVLVSSLLTGFFPVPFLYIISYYFLKPMNFNSQIRN